MLINKELSRRNSSRVNVWEDTSYVSIRIKQMIKFESGSKVEITGLVDRPYDRVYQGCPVCAKKLKKDGNVYICRNHGEVSPANYHIVSFKIYDETGFTFCSFKPMHEDSSEYNELMRNMVEDAIVKIRGRIRVNDKGLKSIDVFGYKVLVKPSVKEDGEIAMEIPEEKNNVAEKPKKKRKRIFKKGKKHSRKDEVKIDEEEVNNEKISDGSYEEGYDDEVIDEEEVVEEGAIPEEIKPVLMDINSRGIVTWSMVKFMANKRGVSPDSVKEYLEEVDSGKFKVADWVVDYI